MFVTMTPAKIAKALVNLGFNRSTSCDIAVNLHILGLRTVSQFNEVFEMFDCELDMREVTGALRVELKRYASMSSTKREVREAVCQTKPFQFGCIAQNDNKKVA